MSHLIVEQFIGTSFGVVFVILRGLAAWRMWQWWRRDLRFNTRTVINLLLLGPALDSALIVAVVLFFMFVTDYRAHNTTEFWGATALNIWVLVNTIIYLVPTWVYGSSSRRRIVFEVTAPVVLSAAVAAALVYLSVS
jgi:hypothetical protein